jgi:acetolactate synthase-1/2/3 large subunit
MGVTHPATGLDPASAAALIARAEGAGRAAHLHAVRRAHHARADGSAGCRHRLVDVRDERAAVYMAHAHAELTGGLGVALVTAGPGVTNAMTGIANAHIARAPVLVLSGLPPRPQDNRGALQDLPHTDLVRPITRYARSVRDPALVLQELGEAIARALGQGGDPGPVYLDFPTDVMRAACRRPPSWLNTSCRAGSRCCCPTRWTWRRRWSCCGRRAGRSSSAAAVPAGAGMALTTLLDRCGALYLDTGESRGLVSDAHPSVVAAMRGSVMSQADVIVVLGRRLDFPAGLWFACGVRPGAADPHCRCAIRTA